MCDGAERAEDGLIDAVSKAFKRFDMVWEKATEKADAAVERGCVS